MEESQHLVKLFGLEFDTWIIYMSWLTMAVLIFIAWLASRKIRTIPKGWQNLMEMFIGFIEGSIKDGMGPRGLKYTYFFGSMFLYILIANMIGLIPALSSPTSNVSVTLCLAVLVMAWMQYISIREIGLVNHLKHFLSPNPAFLPIHLLELITRPLTMALRLFGNIFAGEILLKVLTGLCPYIVPTAWLMVSVAIGAIQAYIFTLLGIAYTGLTIGDSDHH